MTRALVRSAAAALVLVLAAALPLLAQAPPYTVSISDAQDVSGAEVELEFRLDHQGNTVAGWSLGVCHDNGVLDLMAVADGDLIPTLNAGAGPDFNDLSIAPGGQGWTVGLLINFLGMNALPTGDYQLNTAVYQLTGPDGITTDLEYCDTAGAPPVSTVIVDSGNMSWDPIREPGTVTIGGIAPPPVPFFKRGDANGDGSFSGLADGVFVLNFQFIPGSPAPPCMDAADADDSGTISGLVDGLLILNHQFLPGSPPPPPPGPTACGEDPTDDLLDCLVVPAACQ